MAGKYIYLGFTAPVEAGAYIAIATYPGDATHRPSAAKSFFIIHPKAVKVNIDYKEKYVGDKDPELTYKAEGVLDGILLDLSLHVKLAKKLVTMISTQIHLLSILTIS